VSSPSVTVQFPDKLYEFLRTRAAVSRRTVQEELVHVVSLVAPNDFRLPQGIQQELDSLPGSGDEQLWNAARIRVPEDVEERLEGFADRGRESRLSDEDLQQQAELLKECHRVMLLRAHAAALLKQRGYDVSSLGPLQ
jgi:hypothetical protein